MTNSLDILAARYALGVADAAEIETAEALLNSDPSFAAAVTGYHITFNDLHQDIQPIAPPPAVWDRIQAAISGDTEPPQPVTISPATLPWRPIAPNLEQKVLLEDTEGGIRMVLYRAGPGAVVDRHRNAIDEECLVLEGEIEIDGQVLKAGDVQIIAAETMHGPITSRNGAIIYIREAGAPA
jgi:quercetin dioxygenase-like cupin family protein